MSSKEDMKCILGRNLVFFDAPSYRTVPGAQGSGVVAMGTLGR